MSLPKKQNMAALSTKWLSKTAIAISELKENSRYADADAELLLRQAPLHVMQKDICHYPGLINVE